MPKHSERPYTAYSEIVIDMEGPYIMVDGETVPSGKEAPWVWTVRIYKYSGGEPEVHTGKMPADTPKDEVRAVAIAKRDEELAKYAVKKEAA